jgi:cyclopropane fatty-acyl-phospholipid synthase-like methyltransferase
MMSIGKLVDHKQVELLYEILLRRAPESTDVVRRWCDSGMSITQIADAFLHSDEFKPHLVRLGLADYRIDDRSSHKRMAVQVSLDDPRFRQVLNHVKSEWEKVGLEDPHWSVLSADRFRSTKFVNHESEFFESGRDDVSKMMLAVDRSGRELANDANVLELGCGVGRVTRWLAQRFGTVRSYDISGPHLALAKDHLTRCAVDNVTLLGLTDISQLASESSIDLFFSILVLQHNPPPIANALLLSALNSLAYGGLAYFQIPTYMPGYSFDAGEYIDGQASSGGIEMHLLPQTNVFEIIEQTGCRTLEVREDDYTGNTYFISNTFLVEKR